MRSIRGLVLAGVVLAFAASSTMAQPASALVEVNRDAGGIRVLIKPKAIASGSAWEFDVTMETHTKPLDIDLTKDTVLVVGGRRYSPLSWQGDKPGGHHRKGVLRFPAPADQVKAFEVQIQNLGGESLRVFQWSMQ